MNRQDIDFVQSNIIYQFKNLQLLEQAFTRKSYSEEHPEVQNNEVLEFYGDEILDFFVTKMMYKRFSRILNNELVSEKNEGELTKLKSILVSKESLAHCMYNIGFSKFLYLGKSDEKNEVYKSKSVNEDLFEAIIGAVAADCDWNYENLEKVCRTMLDMETTNGYLALLVKEKSHRLGFGEPCYRPFAWQTDNPEDWQSDNLFNMGIGFVLAVSKKDAAEILKRFNANAKKFAVKGAPVMKAYEIGYVGHTDKVIKGDFKGSKEMTQFYV